MAPTTTAALFFSFILGSSFVLEPVESFSILGHVRQQQQRTPLPFTTPSIRTRSRQSLPSSSSASLGVNVCYSPLFATTRSSSSSSSSSEKSAEETDETAFSLHVGKALDTLRNDYPTLLIRAPDFTIYDMNVEVVDPSGVTVHGLRMYKNTFRILRTLMQFLYTPQQSTVTFRMCYDTVRRNIRIHWNAEIVPREIFGGSRTLLHVDGISVYELDRTTGQITQHRIEHLVLNNSPVQPEEGLIAALQNYHGVTVPSFCKDQSDQDLIAASSPMMPPGGNIVQFSSNNNLWDTISVSQFSPSSAPPSSLFAMEASSSGNHDMYPGLDWEALDNKNKSRKKFGLKPLTPEEFLSLQNEVEQMEREMQQKKAVQDLQLEQQRRQQEKETRQRSSVWNKLWNGLSKDTCESNFDCERPEVCCDFGFAKRCCSSGSPVWGGAANPALVPVPVDGFENDPYRKK